MLINPGTVRRRPQASADINMVPLIDIMLVLVVVLLVTTPLLARAVRINLPSAAAAAAPAESDSITLSIDAAGVLYWQDQPLPWPALSARLTTIATQAQQPEIRIRADQAVAYREVMRLMSAVAAAGLSKIGFVTEPHARD